MGGSENEIFGNQKSSPKYLTFVGFWSANQYSVAIVWINLGILSRTNFERNSIVKLKLIVCDVFNILKILSFLSWCGYFSLFYDVFFLVILFFRWRLFAGLRWLLELRFRLIRSYTRRPHWFQLNNDYILMLKVLVFIDNSRKNLYYLDLIL